MRRVKTKLGDIWYVGESTVKPDGSDREYGLTDAIQRIIKNCEADERWAQRLRVIADAPATQNGEAFLIPDPAHEGFSRPISFKAPDFNWKDSDFNNGSILFYNENNDYIIREIVADPGADYGPYHVMKYDYDVEKFTYVGTAEDHDSAALLLEQVVARHLDPLPYIGLDETTIMPLYKGYTAEIIKDEGIHSDRYAECFRIHIIDPFGREVRQFETESASFLVGLRDDLDVFNDAIRNPGSPHNEDAILGFFRRVEPYYPRRVADLDDHIELLQENRISKFRTADDEYEILVAAGTVIDVYRDKDGNKISVGKPNAAQLEGLVGELSVANEPSWAVYVKRTEGVAFTKVDGVIIDPCNLYDVITSEGMQEELVGSESASKAASRLIQSPIDIEHQPRPSKAELIVGAISMDLEDIVHARNKRRYINVSKLIQTAPKSESYSTLEY